MYLIIKIIYWVVCLTKQYSTNNVYKEMTNWALSCFFLSFVSQITAYYFKKTGTRFQEMCNIIIPVFTSKPYFQPQIVSTNSSYLGHSVSCLLTWIYVESLGVWDVRYKVLMVVKMTMLFWAVTPCGFVGRYQHFRVTYCLSLQCLLKCQRLR